MSKRELKEIADKKKLEFNKIIKNNNHELIDLLRNSNINELSGYEINTIYKFLYQNIKNNIKTHIDILVEKHIYQNINLDKSFSMIFLCYYDLNKDSIDFNTYINVCKNITLNTPCNLRSYIYIFDYCIYISKTKNIDISDIVLQFVKRGISNKIEFTINEYLFFLDLNICKKFICECFLYQDNNTINGISLLTEFKSKFKKEEFYFENVYQKNSEVIECANNIKNDILNKKSKHAQKCFEFIDTLSNIDYVLDFGNIVHNGKETIDYNNIVHILNNLDINKKKLLFYSSYHESYVMNYFDFLKKNNCYFISTPKYHDDDSFAIYSSIIFNAKIITNDNYDNHYNKYKNISPIHFKIYLNTQLVKYNINENNTTTLQYKSYNRAIIKNNTLFFWSDNNVYSFTY